MITRMKCWVLALATLITAFGSVAAGDQRPDRTISGVDALADVALMERVLTTVHAGWGRFTPQDEMEAAFARLRDAVRNGTTDAAMYLEVSRLLELIRCDHTKAEYPESLRVWRESNPSFLPVRTHHFGDRMFAGVNRAEGVDRGDEILSINGVDAARMIEEVSALISVDGRTDFARADEAEVSAEYMGSGLDTFAPLLYGWSERFTIVVRDTQGAERAVVADALTYGDFAAMVLDQERYVQDFKDAVSVERLNGTTALLRVDTFINYRDPVDPDEVFGPIMRRLNEDGVDHLIVDLRRNGGGSDDAAISLFRHLLREPVTVYQGALVRTLPIPEDVKAAVTTWDMSALEATPDLAERTPEGMWRLKDSGEQRVEPAPDHFRGRITALSSRGNASGSTLLLSALQHHAGVRIVGEPTGGSVEGPTAGVIVFCRLPASGITVRVPLIRTETGIEPDEPGMGVTPDVLVERTPAAFFSGRDAALEAAARP